MSQHSPVEVSSTPDEQVTTLAPRDRRAVSVLVPALALLLCVVVASAPRAAPLLVIPVFALLAAGSVVGLRVVRRVQEGS